jgi:hypothetical protein
MRTTAACRTGFGEPKRPTQQSREEAYSIQPRGVLWFLFLTLSFPHEVMGGSGGCFLSPSVFFSHRVKQNAFSYHKSPYMSKKPRFLYIFARCDDKIGYNAVNNRVNLRNFQSSDEGIEHLVSQ